MKLLSGFQSLKPTSQYVSFSSLYNEIRQHQIFQISVIYLFIYFLIYIYIYNKISLLKLKKYIIVFAGCQRTVGAADV